MKFYIKKASDQDVSRTTVINTEAAEHFFGVKLLRRNDEAIVKIIYHPEADAVNTVIRRKNDIRIFIDRSGLERNDLILFSKLSDELFSIDIVKPGDSRYNGLDSNLKNNYLLTDQLNTGIGNKTAKYSLNTILFGPPGTGKTDSTIEKSLEILEMQSEEADESKRRAENRELFKSLLNKRIFFVTMHPSYSYEDFVQGLKPSTIDGALMFDNRNGIFKIAAKHADESYQAFRLKSDPSFSIGFDSVFDYAFSQLIDHGEPVVIPKRDSPFKIIAINDRTLKFETSTGGTGPTYNLSRNTTQLIFEKGKNDIILSGNKGYFDSLLEFLNNKRQELESKYLISENNNINHVIILDEINRANISKVFGELVTLIEEDKRIGSENELIVSLPSGESFGVPPNLYIIGTMNTADKSIALVDIALRRRFQFIPVYPDPELIEKFGYGEDKNQKKIFLTRLNEVLLKDKGVDFQVGHAYFLKDSPLADIINQNILPLLSEYYRNVLKTVFEMMDEIGFALDKDYFEKTGLLKY